MASRLVPCAGTTSLFLSLLAPPSSATAREPVPPAAPAPAEEPSTLDGLPALVRAAEERSPALRAARLEAAAAEQAIPVSRRWPEPVVSYGAFLRSVETRVGPQDHRLGVRQAIPWPGRLSAAAKAQEARARSARERLERLRSELERRLRAPWARRVWTEEARAILAEEDALLSEVDKAVRARMSVGKARYEDLTRIVLRRAEIEERRASLVDLRIREEAALRGIAALEPEAPLPEAVPEGLPDTLPPLESLLGAAASNPDVQVALREIEAASATVAHAETRGLPGFVGGLDWIVVGSPELQGVQDAGKDAVIASVGVTIPLWSEAYGAEVEAARSRALAAEARRDAARLKAETAIVKLHNRYAEAGRKMALYLGELVPSAGSALEAARTSYAAGKGSFLDVLELERQRVRYRLEAARARLERALVMAELEYLIQEEVGP